MSSLLVRTRYAIRRSLSRRDGRAALLVGIVAYPLVYFVALGHLSLGGAGFDLITVSNPLSRMVEMRTPFNFEPVARLSLGPLVYLFSPLNVALGMLLGLLVGLNAAVSLVSWRAPEACGIDSARNSGVLGAIPALLGGATCCGPALLFVVGIQATSALVTAFGLLVPLALVMLVGSLFVVGRSADPSGQLGGESEAGPVSG